MKKAKGSTLKTVIFMLILAGIIVGAYFYLTRNDPAVKLEAESTMTEVNKLLEKDLMESYPATPREVLKLYSRMLKCLYGDTMTAQQVEDMSKQIRLLFDDELLLENPLNEHLRQIESDIASYKIEEKTIASYSIEEAANIRYETIDGKEYATLFAYYTTKKKTDFERSYEEFILREDQEGRFKILGWKKAEEGAASFE